MGLSSFNRSRRVRKDAERIEAERFENWNQRRNDAREHLMGDDKRDLSLQEKARQAEIDATKIIGEKVIEGSQPGAHDLPLRQDHAAEIAGRTIIDPQGEGALSPVERVDARVPDATINEKLVEHTIVTDRGPSAKLLEAAQKEAGVIPDDERAKIEAASDRVKPENEATPEPSQALRPTISDKLAEEVAPEPKNVTEGSLPDREEALKERKRLQAAADRRERDREFVGALPGDGPAEGERDQDPEPENAGTTIPDADPGTAGKATNDADETSVNAGSEKAQPVGQEATQDSQEGSGQGSGAEASSEGQGGQASERKDSSSSQGSSSVSSEGSGAKEEGGTAKRSMTDETMESRSKVEIIDAWKHLDWGSRRKLASQLSDEPITNKADAEKAIQAELDRRAAASK